MEFIIAGDISNKFKTYQAAEVVRSGTQIITAAHNFTCAGVHVKPKRNDQKKTICEHPKMAAKLSYLPLFLTHSKFGTNK